MSRRAAAVLVLALASLSHAASKDGLDDFRQRTKSLLAKPAPGHPWPILGADGWIFFRGDLEAVATTEPSLDVAIERISFAAEQLRSAGIHLLVVPIPCKWAIYPDKVFKGYAAGSERLDPWLARSATRLAERSVDVLDLTQAMRDARRRAAADLWIPTDSHNSPAGYELVADAIVEALRPELKMRGLATGPVGKLVPGSFAWYGDLKFYADGNESFDAKRTNPAAWKEIRGRFVSDFKADPSAPIVIAGDSNNEPRNLAPGAWGVGPFVGAKLGLPVDVVVSKASSGLSMRDLFVELRRGARDTRRPRILVWVFASRSLGLGDAQFPALPRLDDRP